jgi:hypothetical protein
MLSRAERRRIAGNRMKRSTDPVQAGYALSLGAVQNQCTDHEKSIDDLQPVHDMAPAGPMSAFRAVCVGALFALIGCVPHEARGPQLPPDRVLFVGNSLTYVGNVPAVLSALAEADGAPMPSDMIVKGGATLSERVADGSVARALADRRYAWLVIQERGGDLMCSLGPASCAQSRQAIDALARMARAKGVKVVLLGSYQPHAQASRRLVDMESAAAADAGIPYVEVSETLRRLRDHAPDLVWFAPDGMHPGKDLALLDAIRLHQALRGRLPAPVPLTVKAPIYGVSSGLDAVLRSSDAPPPRPETMPGTQYDAETIRRISTVVEPALVDRKDTPVPPVEAVPR